MEIVQGSDLEQLGCLLKPFIVDRSDRKTFFRELKRGRWDLLEQVLTMSSPSFET